MRDAGHPNGLTSAGELVDLKASATHSATDNPRHPRVLHAVMLLPAPRGELDRLAGPSNSTAVAADLLHLGPVVPCTKGKAANSGLFTCWTRACDPTARGCHKLTTWNGERVAGRGQS